MSSDASSTGLTRQALRLARALERRKRRNCLANYSPYTKQREFHDAGATHRERLFMAGNQLGKTLAGSFELAAHLSGRYPEWWCGRRFEGPGRYWAAGETRLSTRDTVQKLLVGPPERPAAWGIGGNQADKVCEAKFPRSRLIGCRWPASLPLPGPLVMAADGAGIVSGGEA